MLDFLTGAFGPLSPLTPMPIDTSVEDSGRPSPRRFQYPIGWNIPIGQPGTEGLKLVNFQALRRYADLYSVVRAMLNIRENETAGLTWDVGPTADAQAQLRDDPDRKNKRKDQHDRSAQIVQWFKRIDSNYKGFPKKQAPIWFFSSSHFPALICHPLRSSIKKMADCETTTGHVGLIARTLMKDARRGLNR